MTQAIASAVLDADGNTPTGHDLRHHFQQYAIPLGCGLYDSDTGQIAAVLTGKTVTIITTVSGQFLEERREESGDKQTDATACMWPQDQCSVSCDVG